MPACPAFDPLGPYVTGLAQFVDCHALALGEDGFRALGPGSPVALAINGLLVLMVAFAGWRMLMGDLLSLREAVAKTVLIGFVLALSGQWLAYRTLVYRVVVDGPGELAGHILTPGGLGNAAPELLARVQKAEEAIARAAAPQTASEAPKAQALPTGPGAAQGPALTAAKMPPKEEGDPRLQRAGQVLLVSTLAGALTLRITAGILLALGPVFIACLLFAALRPVFAGWVRVLLGTVLGSIAFACVLALELAIAEPQIAALLAARDAPDPARVAQLSGELLATTVLFALIMLAAVIAVARAAATVRFPEALRIPAMPSALAATLIGPDAPPRPLPAKRSFADNRPRALALADALTAQVRHEQRNQADSSANRARAADTADAARGPIASPHVPLGQSARRTSGQRQSASAGRRDAAG